MTGKEMLKEFFIFLRSRRAYTKFVRNSINLNVYVSCLKDLELELIDRCPEDYMHIYRWASTPESRNYWDNIDDEWCHWLTNMDE